MAMRIAWTEGMALSPQHFQQHDLWIMESCARMGHKTGQAGFSRLGISASALASSMLSLEDCEVIFPSGLYYGEEIQSGLAIEARSFSHLFSPAQQSLDVFLALPVDCQRHTRVQKTCLDQLNADNAQDISFLQPLPRLLFEGEAQDGFEILPLARILRNAQGVAGLDPQFFPPMLTLHAYAPFRALLEKMRGSMQVKIQRLQAFKPSPSGNSLPQFLFLQSLQSFTFVFDELLVSPKATPSSLHLEWARFAGAMQAFRQEALTVLHFDAMHLGEVFSDMQAKLSKILDMEQNSPYSGRRMEKEGQTAFSCGVEGLGLGLGRSAYLAVESTLGADELAKAFVVQAKVASRGKLQAIIVSAMQGIVCQPCLPPSGIQPSPDTHFFQLAQDSNLWNDLLLDAKLGVYAPASLQVKSVGLLVENPQ